MRKSGHVAWLPILAVLVALGSQVQAVTIEKYWQAFYGSPFHGNDTGVALAVDFDDNIIVTGSIESVPGNMWYADMATVKFSPAGETLWARRQVVNPHWPAFAEGIACDQDNNIYVVGTSGLYWSVPWAMTLVKFRPNGDTAWTRRFPGAWFSLGRSVAVDVEGNIYAAGISGYFINVDSENFMVVKCDSAGNTLWTRYVDGPAHKTDSLVAMCLDPDGNVLLTGSTRDPDAPLMRDWLTAKFSPDGDSLWVRRYDRGEHRDDYPVGLATDDAGGVYVCGASYRNTTGWDYQVVKYSPTGDTLLTAWYNNQVTNADDLPSAIAVDRYHNIYATGTCNDTVVSDPQDSASYATVKWSAVGGLPNWVRRYRGARSSYSSAATDMKLDRYGNIYVTGFSDNAELSCLEQATLKYDPYGNLKWDGRVANSDGDAHAKALALDSRGSVYVAGDDYVDGELWDYSLTRFSGPNVGVARVIEPHDTIRINRTITPTIMVYNYSPIPALNIPVYMFIGSTVFSLNIPSIAAFDSTPVLFNSWASRDAGDFPIYAYTTLSDDWENGDDTARGFVSVVLPWVAKDSVPGGPKKKSVKDGGSLAFDDTLNVIYAVKGNNTYEFYSYGPVASWTLRESVPAGSGRRKVKKGAELVYGGSNLVYLAKGNKTAEFWAFHPAAGWVAKPNLPSVLKGGTAVTFAPNMGRIYVLPGSNTRQLWAYDTSGAWISGMPDMPNGPKNKLCKDGTALAYDGSQYLYALKGKTSEFYAYDVTSNAWYTKDLLPNSTQNGKKKTSGDGASFAFANGLLYAFKGNNTNEFWCWDPGLDTWSMLDSMTTGLKKKKVKAGGSLVAVHGKIYALKGNGTNEFYMYNANVAGFFGVPGQPNQQGDVAAAGLKLGLRVAPNPFRGTSVVMYNLPRPGKVSVKLYDATGRLGMDLFTGRQRAGSYRLGLAAPELSAGVYFLKMRFDDGTDEQQVTAKVLVER